MKCSDINSSLSIYCDGFLNESESATVASHLEVCPLCRQRVADINEIRADLRLLRRPELADDVRHRLKAAARTELLNDHVFPISAQAMEWVQMKLMPYTVGVAASLVLGSLILAIMLSGMLRPSSVFVANSGRDTSINLAGNNEPGKDMYFISPVDFSRSRMAFSSESPSLNPQGALVALTKSLVRGEMKDEEVVVVAEVFGNGLARISQVVESPRNRRTVNEFEKAFGSDITLAPFVPAVMENRPENMQIVLRFQSVNVSASARPPRRRS